MEFLAHYFTQNNLDNVFLYILGKDSDKQMFQNFCRNVAIKKLFVLNISDCPVNIDGYDIDASLIKKEDVKNLPKCSVLFDNVKNISELLPEKNNGVYGVIAKNDNSLSYWEKLYHLSDRIVIVTHIDDYNDRVLDWSKEDGETLLSVVLPVYNVSQYIEKCIQTIIAWKAPYVEFLFVDDGSPDNSKEIIQKYQEDDKRIKILQKENGGCASARQFGLERAKGKYVAFIDPDDFVDEEMLETLLSSAMSGSFDISYCGYNEYYEDTKTSAPVKDLTGEPYTFGTFERREIDELIAFRKIAIWRAVYLKKFLEKNHIRFNVDLKRFDDLPFKIETTICAKSVISVDRNLYFYRLGRKGQDVSANDKRLFIHFDIFRYLDKRLNEIGMNFEQEKYYKMVKVQTHFWALSIMLPEFKEEYRKLAAEDLGIENNKKSWKTIMNGVISKKEQKLIF